MVQPHRTLTASAPPPAQPPRLEVTFPGAQLGRAELGGGGSSPPRGARGWGRQRRNRWQGSGCGRLGVRGQVCGGPVLGETGAFSFLSLHGPGGGGGSRGSPEMPTGRVVVSLCYRWGAETCGLAQRVGDRAGTPVLDILVTSRLPLSIRPRGSRSPTTWKSCVAPT